MRINFFSLSRNIISRLTCQSLYSPFNSLSILLDLIRLVLPKTKKWRRLIANSHFRTGDVAPEVEEEGEGEENAESPEGSDEGNEEEEEGDEEKDEEGDEGEAEKEQENVEKVDTNGNVGFYEIVLSKFKILNNEMNRFEILKVKK